MTESRSCLGCASCPLYSAHVINVEQIMDSVAKLKLGKLDCPQQIFSDNIINGTHKLYAYIALLIRCMLVYGSLPA